MDDRDRLLEVLNKQEPFNEDIQKRVGRDRAVVYAVYLIENNNIEATFQRVSIALFKLFPESFSFSEFPEYPDSRSVRNCLWHCAHKSKEWLVGSDKTHYNTTEKGKEIVQIFLKLIEGGMNIEALPYGLQLKGKTKNGLTTKPRDKEQHFLSEIIKKSGGYSKFINYNKDNIKSIDVKKSLGGDRYSPTSYLHDKLIESLRYSENYNEKDIELYLKWIKENWSKLMED